jgi:hypothetical protein
MNAYKVEILVIDFDGIGPGEIKDVFENIKYPNYCMYPSVMHITGKDIGEWTDEHPLNLISEKDAEYKRVFG